MEKIVFDEWRNLPSGRWNALLEEMIRKSNKSITISKEFFRNRWEIVQGIFQNETIEIEISYIAKFPEN